MINRYDIEDPLKEYASGLMTIYSMETFLYKNLNKA